MGLFDKVSDALSNDESSADEKVNQNQTPPSERDKVNVDERSGIIYQHYEKISQSQAERISGILKKSLDDLDEYKHRDIRENIVNEVGLSPDLADRIVQNEHASIQLMSTVRDYISQMNRAGDEWEFYISGPTDDRTHPVTEEAINETNPFKGGNALKIEELRGLLESKAEKYSEEGATPERIDHWVAHEKPRYTIVRKPNS